MFKKKYDHRKRSFFSVFSMLSKSQIADLKKSGEYKFYEIVFKNIEDEIFAPLFTNVPSRPNAPVKTMVSALILKSLNDWTYEELFSNMKFNILTRSALGIFDFNSVPFCPATLYNFQNKLMQYHIDTGKDLLNQTLDRLIETLDIDPSKTKDRFLKELMQELLYMKKCLHLQHLVEVIQRKYGEMSAKEKRAWRKQFGRYLSKTSGRFVSGLARDEIDNEISRITDKGDGSFCPDKGDGSL